MRSTATFFSMVIALSTLSASAEDQKSSKLPSATAPAGNPIAACPSPGNVTTTHLYGLWQVTFFDGPLPADQQAESSRTAAARATVLFERHPEHADSLRGAMKAPAMASGDGRNQVIWLSGDLDEGELILDESDNGQRISAVWVAHPAVDGCGKVFRGNRRLADTDVLQTFIMTKTPGWR
jgi:hypothetical protein